MNAAEVCEPLAFLCNSSQRLQILDVLGDTRMDVRDVKDAVDGSRSTVQRNISKLEQRGWINKASAGYTTTAVGELLYEEFVAVSESTDAITRMTPFIEAVDEPEKIDSSQLTDVLVTTPDPGQPTSLMNRLSDLFGEADHVRGFLPVVSSLSVELSRRAVATGDDVPECDYIISSDAFDTLRQQYENDGTNGDEMDAPAHISIRVYEGTLPYGLFISDEQLALAAYDEIGRIEAVVESTNEETIEWGEREYEKYRRQTIQPHETERSSVVRDVEPVDQSPSSI